MKVKQLIPVQKEIEIDKLIEQFNNEYTLRVHDNLVVEFANSVSKSVLKNKLLRQFPAFVSLAYWLRKSNFKFLIASALSSNNENIQLKPLGAVLHICPSNVDTMFVYSLFLSLLSGNKNILRISSKLDSQEIDELFNILSSELSREEFIKINNYITVIAYGYEREVNEKLSLSVDCRLIWGGDSTVEMFKGLKTKIKTKDFYFADRVSCCIIVASTYLELSENSKNDFTQKFYNDTYTFDQKGCSSPQIILILGTSEEYCEFKNNFKLKLHQFVSREYIYDPMSLASLKLNKLSEDAIERTIASYDSVNNSLIFCELTGDNIPHSCGGGYFYIKNIEEINQLKNFFSQNIQTISQLGLSHSQIEFLVQSSYGQGVDRIVNVGKALEFNPTWDGYDLLQELTSKLFVEKQNFKYRT